MAHLLPHTHAQTNHGAPAVHRDKVQACWLSHARAYCYYVNGQGKWVTYNNNKTKMTATAAATATTTASTTGGAGVLASPPKRKLTLQEEEHEAFKNRYVAFCETLVCVC
jgi:hypothetical protein